MTEPYPGQPLLSSPPPPVSSPQAPPATTVDGIEWLRQLEWRQFEQVIGTAYQLQGYQVLPTADRADGGIDLILIRGAERIFVQCKHWKAWQVPVTVVRELFGVVVANRASGGIVVTSGTFSREAMAFAQQSGITLLDGPAVLQLVAAGRMQTPPPPAQQPTPHLAMPPTSLGTPACPICLAPMALRKARRGQRAGSSFWGCARYPGCKGVLEAPGMTRAPQRGRGRGSVAPPRSSRRTTRSSGVRFGLALVYLLTLPLVLWLVWTVFSSIHLRPLAPSPVVVPSARLVPSVAAPAKGGPASAAPAALGEQPMDIAIDTKAKRLYTANFVSGNVSVLDENSLQVVDTIDVPGQPIAIAVDPESHRIFVADGAGKKIYVVDARSHTNIAMMRSGKGVADLALDSKHHSIFVANFEEKTISAYDTRTSRRVGSVKAYGEPRSMAVDVNDGLLYVVSMYNVLTYRTSTLASYGTPKIAMSAKGIAVDPKRKRLYTVLSNFVQEQNLLTGKSELLNLDGNATALCIDPSTRTAYLADPDGNVVRQLHLK